MDTNQWQLRRAGPDIQLDSPFRDVPQLPLRAPQRNILPAKLEGRRVRLARGHPFQLVKSTQPYTLAFWQGDVLRVYDLVSGTVRDTHP